MKRFLPALSVGLAAALTLAGGLIHGRMSNRWGSPRSLVDLGHKLQDIPDRFGDWQLEKAGELSDTVVKVLECAGYIVRTYVNQSTGEAVTVTLLVGDPVPLSLHPPEVCYQGAGYEPVQQREPFAVPQGGSNHEFWTVLLRDNDAANTVLQVVYAWSTGGRWSRLEESRLKIAGYPYLYKIQVSAPKDATGPMALRPRLEANNACGRFIRDFVPAVEQYLVESSTD